MNEHIRVFIFDNVDKMNVLSRHGHRSSNNSPQHLQEWKPTYYCAKVVFCLSSYFQAWINELGLSPQDDELDVLDKLERNEIQVLQLAF